MYQTFRKIGVEGRSVPGYSSLLEGNVLCGLLDAYLEKGLRDSSIRTASSQKIKILMTSHTSPTTPFQKTDDRHHL